MDEAERGTQQDASRDDAPFAFGTPRDDPPRRERRAASDPAAGSPDAVAPTHAPASVGAALSPESDEFTAEMPRESSRYRVGRPIASAFSIVRRRGLALLVVLVAYAPVFVVDVLRQAQATFSADSRGTLLAVVVRGLCGTFVVGATCDLVARHLSGDPPALGESLVRGLVALPALLVLHVLQALSLIIPLFLFSFLAEVASANPPISLLFAFAGLAVNLVLAARMLPAAAVLVTERRATPVSVLRRTDALTRGFRRRLVGTLIVASTFVLVLWFAIGIVVGPRSPAEVRDAMRIAFELLCVGTAAVGPGVVYHELRAASEGPRPEELAQIFA